MTRHPDTTTDARARFLDAVADVRPALHRYCARMTGSVVDGEDVVQDTLERAFEALSSLDELPPLKPWLFRIAHHRAIDLARRYERRMADPLQDDHPSDATTADPEQAMARADALQLAVARFVELPPLQRSCVVLKDVLGYPVNEIVTLLDSSEPAVKAALHRGRETLRSLAAATDHTPGTRHASPALTRYAALFNTGDWDALRALLADDVRLDLLNRPKRRGRVDVGGYYSNYARIGGIRLVPAWLDGNEVLAAYRTDDDTHPAYIVLVTIEHDEVVSIRDFRYVPYIGRDLTLTFA